MPSEDPESKLSWCSLLVITPAAYGLLAYGCWKENLAIISEGVTLEESEDE